ncbi:hypothetical protein PTSG_08258 [Salpingoeca rosetta]|uniref:Uncharacterized protein n=1 Tax=Salpingoeca rosetta (strain ATCC 50818 / BSB-021) TaxID=946362 RepID=F2UIG4_SALR5|nr:uncharacterized protein PTSG_08258 [Salpingoeca rosetta]EGD76913.1 hypothetical protein PTSG_08258 [Salpingoeca rosetta]|eukprot:XP_004991284.1 hypothetical protein PTSG_08258 [Salpingoeca rosetta]
MDDGGRADAENAMREQRAGEEQGEEQGDEVWEDPAEDTEEEEQQQQQQQQVQPDELQGQQEQQGQGQQQPAAERPSRMSAWDDENLNAQHPEQQHEEEEGRPHRASVIHFDDHVAPRPSANAPSAASDTVNGVMNGMNGGNRDTHINGGTDHQGSTGNGNDHHHHHHQHHDDDDNGNNSNNHSESVQHDDVVLSVGDMSVTSPVSTLSDLTYTGRRLNTHPAVRHAVHTNQMTVDFARAMIPQRADKLYGEYIADRIRLAGLRINTLSTGDPVDFVLVYSLGKYDEEEIAERVLDPHHADGSEEKRERERLRFELNLMRKGLVIERESSGKHIAIVKVHCPFKRLCERAQVMQMKLPLKKDPVYERLQNDEVLALKYRLRRVFEAVLPDAWAARMFFDDASRFDTDRSSTAHFSIEHAEKFENFETPHKFFSPAQRSVLVRYILLNTKYGHNAVPDSKAETKVGIDRLMRKGTYVDAFPLHDSSFDLPSEIDAMRGEVVCSPTKQKHSSRKHTFDNNRINAYGLRAILLETWGRFWCVLRAQPLGLVREYFGEKVAFYFAWLGFYTTWLIIPSVVGFLTLFYGVAQFQGRADTTQVCQSNVTMCAVCDTCEKWQLNSSCTAAEATYIFDNEATIAFAFFMSLWATVFTEYWKRSQAELSFDWNMVDHDDFEPLRPQFRASTTRKNLITDQNEPHYPAYRRYLKYILTASTVLTVCATVIIILISTIVYRIAVYTAYVTRQPDQQDQASLIASGTAAVINLILIITLSFFYRYLAVWLTDWENHKTTSKYEQHLTIKIFTFQFFNSFGSLFYIAFFQHQDIGVPGDYDTFFGYQSDSCPAYGCLLELTIQLAVIMVGRQAFNNVLEIGLPLLKAWWRKCRLRLKTTQHNDLLPWEEDYLLLDAYPRLGLFDDYLEMCMQYGFITLFVASFPLAPFFALINNIFEIRVDASKFIGLWRRPIAERAAGLGLWRQVLEFLTLASVITNGMVISFTSNFVDKLVYRESRGSLDGFYLAITAESPYDGPLDIYRNCRYFGVRDADGEYKKLFYEILMGKLAFFIVFEHVVFLTKFLAQVIIPDEPRWVTIARKREVYQARAIIEGLSDTHYLNAEENEITNQGLDADSIASTEERDGAELRRRRPQQQQQQQSTDESII